MMNILVINPNSSQKLQTTFRKLWAPRICEITLLHCTPEFTNRNHPKNSQLSETAVLQDFKERKSLKEYDAFLVCCYSDHPLVESLADFTKKPVLGIMQATLLYALLMPGIKLFILTSTSDWEPVLDKGVMDFVGTDEFPLKSFIRPEG